MSSSRSGLGTLETISVVGAVIASPIALFYNQAILALVPVSASLALNLINRRRLEAFLDQSADVTTEVKQLRRDVTLLGTTSEKVTQDMQNLMPRQELTAHVDRVEELHQQQEGLRLSLVPLQSRLDDLIQEFNRRPELEEIESLTIVIEALKQSIDQLPQQSQASSLTESTQNSEGLGQLKRAIDLLHYQFNNRPELVEIAGLSIMTQGLKESVDLLSLNNQSPSSREFQRVGDSVGALSQNTEQVERLQKSITLLEHQLEHKIWELRQETLAKS
jgi:hypothetical protein